MPAAKLPSMPLVGLTGTDKEAEAKQLEAVATQFEGLFMHMMLKSMRAVNRVFSEGNYLSSFETGMYEDMLDEKLSTSMSSTHALGIADMMIRQLGDQPRPTNYALPMGAPALLSPAPSSTTSADQAAKATQATVERLVRRPPGVKIEPAQRQAVFDSPQAFVEGLRTDAQVTAAQLGLAPRGLLAQAALESGWGQHVIHDGAGANSHNLFGIKAGKDWHGATVAIASVEVSNGVVGRQVSHFKRYDSYGQAFADYAKLLQGDARYRSVLQAGKDTADFSRNMGQSGYATDPDYAKKLDRVMTHPALVASIAAAKEA